MKDRIPKYPGRVQLVPVEGMVNTYTLAWADEATQTGTPLNKASLLSDTVAAALRLSQDDPTVNDAFAGIATGFAMVTVSDRAPTEEDTAKAGDIWINESNTGHPVSICLAVVDGVSQWYGLRTSKTAPRTIVFTASTTWTVPAEALGAEAVAYVYGAGGGPGKKLSGGGGGGGEMAVWNGTLTEPKYEIVIGVGGEAGAAGGASSFGTVASADGGSAGTIYAGGSGGSGGGGMWSSSSSPGQGGDGLQFGGGGGSAFLNTSSDTFNSGPGGSGVTEGGETPTKYSLSAVGGQGVDTTGLDVPDIAKGIGAGGNSGASVNAVAGGGGGGYGGTGGNGSTLCGGGGGGYGVSGNGASKGQSAGYGGGGAYDQKGGNGIVVVIYQGW